jgi:MarR family 2-MHQ and catechol resistance regulon transcriptional repressor
MASGTHVWLLLMKAHRSMQRHAFRSIESLDMCFSDFAVLELLLHKGPQPVNTIGKRVDLTSGSITTAIDRLEVRGLVQRGFDPDDRRARVVSLTKSGTVRIREVFVHHERAMDRAASGLSKTERDALAKLLKKLGMSAAKIAERSVEI